MVVVEIEAAIITIFLNHF